MGLTREHGRLAAAAAVIRLSRDVSLKMISSVPGPQTFPRADTYALIIMSRKAKEMAEDPPICCSDLQGPEAYIDASYVVNGVKRSDREHLIERLNHDLWGELLGGIDVMVPADNTIKAPMSLKQFRESVLTFVALAVNMSAAQMAEVSAKNYSNYRTADNANTDNDAHSFAYHIARRLPAME